MTLDEARNHIGDAVVYNSGHDPGADGTIVRVSHQFVFVRYGYNDTSIAATQAEHLTLLSAGPP